ncbi:DUF2087 domain-containing protein [Streptomyces sp. NPDC052114]|uniref:DUF2087 domain-containing protein n=1 Tax=unclassified Streptomyces TaxID=2593676 RepID=UPI00341D0144
MPRLLRAGLITRTGTGALVAVPDAFRRAAEEDRGRRAPQEAAAGEGPGRAVAQLFSGGRLVVMPVRRALRRALLEHLAERFFEPGRRYTETEVNTALGQCYDDYSTLRRYLIDERLLARSPEGSAYWRSVAA